MPITTASDSLVATAADPIKFLLNDLDLYPVTFRLRSTYPTLKVDLLVKEYRRFLVLKLAHRDEHAKLLSPSPLIDLVWHDHILDTRSYIPMCLAVGLWIHHDPDGANDYDAANRARRRENTVDLYTARFGPMDLDCWDMEGFRRPYLPGKAPSQGHAGSLRKRQAETDQEKGAASGERDANEPATKKQRTSSRIKLRFRDSKGTEIEFHARLSTKFSSVAGEYAKLKGQHMGDLRFELDERLLRTDSLWSLEELLLMDGDVVDVSARHAGC